MRLHALTLAIFSALACILLALACSRIEGEQRLAEEVDAGRDASLADPLTPETACLSKSYGIEQVRLALMLLVDRSGSTRFAVEPAADEGDAGAETAGDAATLDNSNRWEALTAAISKFVRATAPDPNVLVGLQFFPLETKTNDPLICAANCRTCNCVFACGCNGCLCNNAGCHCLDGTYSCDEAQYASPAVPFTQASAAVSSIEAALGSQIPIGATPTRPALEGVARYARDWAREHPEDKAVVVVATDGVPSASLCTPNSIADNVRVVSLAVHGTPSIPTFVIGVGSALEALDEIAAAGGSEQAFLVDTQTELEARFFEILERTRRALLPCRFALPTAPNAEADPERVRLSLGPTDEVIARVADRSKCSAVNGGFHYDSASEPHELVLCPASCATLRGTAKSTLELLMGCRSSAPR